MSLLGKLFPETLFARRLSSAMEHRLRLAQARAEEALTHTHVENALLFVQTLEAEVGFERAIAIYVRELGISDPLAETVTTRALVALGKGVLVTGAHETIQSSTTAELAAAPRLRLDDTDPQLKRA